MASPAWLAVMLHVPADTSVSVEPFTVHTGKVVEAKLTVREEVAVADSVRGEASSVWLPGPVKLMLCGVPKTVKVRTTDMAAAKLPPPAWLAVMLQLPAVTNVSVVLLTVQTPVVVEVKVTGRPDEADATSAAGDVPMVWLPGSVKLMVWLPGATVNVRATGVAAAVVLLPGWLAVMVQLPADTSVSVVPDTVHTPSVDDAKLTVRPELAVATSADGATPKVWLPGEVKLMVCDASGAVPTVMVTVTFAPAATLALPAWLATIVQVPADTSVSAVPLTVHTAVVLEATVTVSPALELNISAGVAVPKVWLPGDVKVIVWVACATLKLRDTKVAAA